jgi:hypothetical protein
MEGSSMARVNIYVPDDLKRRMDEAEGVNWSPLACRAFEMKLAEVSAKKKEKNMNDVINRLKGSANKYNDEAYLEGKEHGRKWAEDHATTEELGSLEKLTSSWDEGLWDRALDPAPTEEYTGREVLFNQIRFNHRERGRGDRAAARFFWDETEPQMCREYDGPRYLRGFADGALDLWRDVKDQL